MVYSGAFGSLHSATDTNWTQLDTTRPSVGFVGGRMGRRRSTHCQHYAGVGKKNFRKEIDRKSDDVVEAERELIRQESRQDRDMVSSRDYNLNARFATLRIYENKRDVARERYQESRGAYGERFGEDYDPLVDRLKEIAIERERASTDLEEWKEKWFKDTNKASFVFVFGGFALLVIVALLSVLFKCVIMKWC
jgi:hypothetical protein